MGVYRRRVPNECEGSMLEAKRRSSTYPQHIKQSDTSKRTHFMVGSVIVHRRSPNVYIDGYKHIKQSWPLALTGSRGSTLSSRSFYPAHRRMAYLCDQRMAQPLVGWCFILLYFFATHGFRDASGAVKVVENENTPRKCRSPRSHEINFHQLKDAWVPFLCVCLQSLPVFDALPLGGF